MYNFVSQNIQAKYCRLTNFQVAILTFLKITIDISKIERFKKFSRLRVRHSYTTIILKCLMWRSWQLLINVKRIATMIMFTLLLQPETSVVLSNYQYTFIVKKYMNVHEKLSYTSFYHSVLPSYPQLWIYPMVSL